MRRLRITLRSTLVGRPCIWYAADPLCTLRVWNILRGQYVDAPEHSDSIYNLEKMSRISVSWMHRCRVYVDRERALESCKEGQRLWWDSLLEVYEGASEILGQNLTPNYLRIMKVKSKGRLTSLNLLWEMTLRCLIRFV